jgi:hypothetical protein
MPACYKKTTYIQIFKSIIIQLAKQSFYEMTAKY